MAIHDDPERIWVQVRTIFGGRGGSEETIHCPARDRTVSVDECLECHASDGLASEDGREYVRCRRLAMIPGQQAQPLELFEATPVWQLMSGDVICVDPNLPASDLARLLLDEAIHGAPVVDGTGRAIGVVSQSDLLRRIQLHPQRLIGAGPRARRELLRENVSQLDGLQVADVMTRGATTISERAPASQAAALMAQHRMHRLPVLGDDGKVVGILTAFDLIRWLARRGAAHARAPEPVQPAM